MTVEELIKKLEAFPPAMRVLGRGYESGWEDIEDIEQHNVYYFPDNPWYEGKYQTGTLGLEKSTDNMDVITID